MPSSAAHGFNGGVDRAVGRHHNGYGGRGAGEGGIEDFHAGVSAEAEVSKEEIDFSSFEDLFGLGEIGGKIAVEAFLESHAEGIAGGFLVVDDE